MASRAQRVQQQLKDGAIAGAASTLRQTQGVAAEPKHTRELQDLFPTHESHPGESDPRPPCV
eukprot:2873745-Prorocentrum_lima.AAC.1